MDERRPGRAPGFKHSEETRQKITDAAKKRKQSPETRRKISESMKGRTKSEDHRDNISYGMLDIDNRCIARFAELKANYPDHAEFFEENEIPLLIALRDVKSDKEIEDIKKYVESEDIDRYAGTLSYQYSSRSFHAQEDAVITLLDTISYLRKFH